MQDQFLYSIKEATRALGIGRTKLYEMLKIGQLSSLRIGTRRLVKVESIKTFLGDDTAGAA